jgi:hypothetical protein
MSRRRATFAAPLAAEFCVIGNAVGDVRQKREATAVSFLQVLRRKVVSTGPAAMTRMLSNTTQSK